MPAYWIARARVIDPERYARYAEQVPGIIARYGGRVLVRGGPYEIVEGPQHFTRFIVIEFPSMDAALACYRSDEYQQARKHRLDGAGEAEITMVDGGEHTSHASLQAAAR